jgi:hypothetical protein
MKIVGPVQILRAFRRPPFNLDANVNHVTGERSTVFCERKQEPSARVAMWCGI